MDWWMDSIRQSPGAQALDALSLVHDAGVAHRSLSSGASVLLTADAQDKGAALERLTASLLRVKLANFGFSTRLADASPERLESLARFGVDLQSEFFSHCAPPIFLYQLRHHAVRV